MNHKRNVSFVFGILSSIFLFPAIGITAPAKLDLQGAMNSALGENPTVERQQEKVNVAEERYKQSIGTLLPKIRGENIYTKQQRVRSLTGSTGPDHTQLTRINLTQPIFKGMSEYASLSFASEFVSMEKLNLQEANLKLKRDVVTAFYNILILEADKRNTEKLKELTEKRAKELRSRTQIGRSRKSELLLSESQVMNLEATIRGTGAEIQAARQRFAVLTNTSDTVELGPKPHGKIVLPPVEDYLQGMQERPMLSALQKDANLSEETMAINRGKHFPQLDLGANYYIKRTGQLFNAKWDVTLNLVVPLFEGGTTQSAVREAGHDYIAKRKALEAAKRDTTNEVNNLYTQVQYDLEKVKAYEKAIVYAEESYEEQMRDYRLGLVTNLEVIQSLNTFIETKKNYDRLKLQVELNYEVLNLITGKAS